MNKELKNILESDLLERFVLGEVSASEIERINLLRQKYPEVNGQLTELELTLENTALDNKITVPLSLGQSIVKETTRSSNKAFTNKSWLWVAGILISIGLAFAYFMNSKLNDLEKKLAEKEQAIAFLKLECEKVNTHFAFINDVDTRPALLAGTDFAPKSQVIVFWNEKKKACLLKVAELPDISKDQTYQLWADVEGEMKSLGTFDHLASVTEPVKMAFLENAESLNVTVEKEGGSDHPDVATLSASVSI